MRHRQLIGSLILLIVAVIWGTAFAFQRMGTGVIGPMTFTASRMTLSSVAVGFVSFLIKDPEMTDAAGSSARRRDTLTGGVLCGLFLVSATLFQQIGIAYTTAGKAGFITALYILLVPIISTVFLRKPSSWIVWIAVLLGLAGMYLLCMTEGFSLARGDALVCVCAMLFTGHILCCDRFAGRGNPVRISAIQFVTASVVSWTLAFIFETPSVEAIRSALVPILYCGLASGGIGYTLQIVAQRFTNPTVASLLMSFESVFAVLGGAVLLHERMSIRELLGCMVMFIAIIVVQIPVPHKSQD
ncbi:MAG: DMT family transporter [Sphaerochaetaceae bacterium]|nr:DMT family transporter [Sphaerochaetaceae bacterium]